MQKISDSTSTANADGEFTEGNPQAGADATLIKAAWLNAIQREIVAVILAAGLNLNKNDDTQLSKAVSALAGSAADFNKLLNKPTTLGGYGITDTYRAVDIDHKLNGKINGDWADTIGFAGDNPAQPYMRQTSTGTNFLLAPANHGHSFSSLTGIPTTLAGHGIYDAFTKTQVEALINGEVARLIGAAPGAVDTIEELAKSLNNNPNFATDVINGLSGKADKATTIQGYGITDCYRVVDVDYRLDAKANWGTTLADYRITDSYRAVDVDYKLVFKADRASTAAGYGLTDVHTLTSFMKPVTGQWVGLSGSGAIPAGGTWAYFVVSYNNVGVIAQSGAGVTTGGTTVGFTNSSNGFAWRIA
ncbi:MULTISPECIES: hypothetical protein [Pseudomonas]|uniref:hypothetical protein n=1 Tax=Pseudomonas TaxID=286 RepID=UPI000896F1C4|nr:MULTISPECIES: hypothetical protein [Pseudomonas]KAA8702885.1 hypothetical protein F4W61_10635 [Pseudomonas proteolytica]MBT9303681.1 hypothetical protein [Pseudomonas sp. TAE6080]TWR80818.1 hypothetical protein FIV38_16045 [Pseudomonas proteolytica]SEE19972.1 hypothetical protein SAMN04490200_3843 [Pseudomonas proteolytica]